jgi:hypothetical protein
MTARAPSPAARLDPLDKERLLDLSEHYEDEEGNLCPISALTTNNGPNYILGKRDRWIEMGKLSKEQKGALASIFSQARLIKPGEHSALVDFIIAFVRASRDLHKKLDRDPEYGEIFKNMTMLDRNSWLGFLEKNMDRLDNVEFEYLIYYTIKWGVAGYLGLFDTRIYSSLFYACCAEFLNRLPFNQHSLETFAEVCTSSVFAFAKIKNPFVYRVSPNIYYLRFLLSSEDPVLANQATKEQMALEPSSSSESYSSWSSACPQMWPNIFLQSLTLRLHTPSAVLPSLLESAHEAFTYEIPLMTYPSRILSLPLVNLTLDQKLTMTDFSPRLYSMPSPSREKLDSEYIPYYTSDNHIFPRSSLLFMNGRDMPTLYTLKKLKELVNNPRNYICQTRTDSGWIHSPVLFNIALGANRSVCLDLRELLVAMRVLNNTYSHAIYPLVLERIGELAHPYSFSEWMDLDGADSYTDYERPPMTIYSISHGKLMSSATYDDHVDYTSDSSSDSEYDSPTPSPDNSNSHTSTVPSDTIYSRPHRN